MVFEPKDLFEKLEFDKILELVQKKCSGELARQQLEAIMPSTDYNYIESALAQTAAAKKGLEESESLPIQRYEAVDDDLKFLSVEASVLNEEALVRVHKILYLADRLFKYFSPGRKKKYEALFELIRNLNYDAALSSEIKKVVDDEGNIRANASELLQTIRRKISAKQIDLDRAFKKIIGEYRKKGWLSDNVESIRNGRRVLSVPAEYKRKIKGIIHDESTTGRTAFIEPEPIILINNDIFDLQTEERREIYRILKELSALLRPYGEDIAAYQEVIVEFDIILSKALLAQDYLGEAPILVDHPHIGWKAAKHPLLYLKNKSAKKETVPFNLELFGKNRLLLLSGPNAGGKSITMKSLGLLQLMVQSGFLVPAKEQSKVGIFKTFCADIGDQQSIEDDLSTYSSRLKNMRLFLEKSDEHTMVLIDEFGSGTDPKIGGAIAEAILKFLHQKKVYGLITTHYPNLKIFAFKTKGIVNGSMTFDKEHLSPTYQLKVGTPGSSYAYEIAQKSKLPKNVLDYARKRTGKNEKAVDELLVNLQNEHQELKDKINKIKDKEAKLAKLIKNYEQLHKELELRRKQVKLDAKENNLQQVARENRQFENLIREIKEEKNLEKAKEAASKIKHQRETLKSDVANLREDIYYKPTENLKDKPLEVGDFVKLRTGGGAGKIELIKKDKAVVVMGLMKMTTKLRDLIPANAPLDIRKTKSIQLDTKDDGPTFESKIDLRGLTIEEALKLLEVFIDKALVSSATQLRIVHGKGTGVLRTAVKRKLKEYKDLGKNFHPQRNEGGDGVTIVEMV